VPFADFAIALFIGALVGIERERRKIVEDAPAVGGLRTFILIAEAGALAAWMSLSLASAWVFVATGLLVIGAMITSFALHSVGRQRPQGLTTIVAAATVFLLGGTVMLGHAEVAVALAIATSAVLAFKRPLHSLVARLGPDDLFAGLKLLIATFIVLPVIPNAPIDPWGAINPYKMWWLVILISSLSLAGYAAGRLLGPGRGAALTGLLGGLVSSTAATLSFARHSRESALAPALLAAVSIGVLLAWGLMFVRVVVEVAVVNPTLVGRVAWPMAMMALVTALVALLMFRASRGAPGQADLELKTPFSLTAAIQFAAAFAVVLLVVKLAETYLPASGLYAVAALAGLTDVDAITLSVADRARDSLDHATAARAIVVAAVTNTVVKAGLVALLGAPALRARILPAAAAIIAAGVLSALWL
jgi:uncharacterized membrane protein (DUF4010 family)